MGRAPAVLSARAAAVLAAALLAILVVYDTVAGSLPNLPLWWDVALTAGVLVPATFALVLLGLPLRERRGLLPVGLALGVLAAVLEIGSLEIPANYAKLAAVTLLAWWFLTYFEQLSWVIVVAAVIPLVDALSVWRGPTRHIVEEEPQVFGALSVAFPVPDAGSFELGLPDVLFFALFLGAAARWSLRVGWTWIALAGSFGATMALAIAVDPFGIGGLPALPLLSLGFVAANADMLWRRLRDPASGLPPMELGYPGTELRRQLVDAVLRGEKTATSSLRAAYEPYGDDPMPVVGERCALLDVADRPVAIVETTEVRVVPAGEIDLEFARDEGEGFESVAEWRARHERFWSDSEIDDGTLVVAERFRLVRGL